MDFQAVIDNQRTLLDAQLGYVRALSEFEQATADLERAVGADLPEGTTASVTQARGASYDGSAHYRSFSQSAWCWSSFQPSPPATRSQSIDPPALALYRSPAAALSGRTVQRLEKKR